MRIGLVLAVVVAFFSALLLLGEKEKLPSYDQLKLEYVRMAEGGYDLVNLESPRLFGKPLQVLLLHVRAAGMCDMLTHALVLVFV